jgi:hypothetical protein
METINPIFLADKVSNTYQKPNIQLVNPIKASSANSVSRGNHNLKSDKIRRSLSISLAALIKGCSKADYFQSSEGFNLLQ